MVTNRSSGSNGLLCAALLVDHAHAWAVAVHQLGFEAQRADLVFDLLEFGLALLDEFWVSLLRVFCSFLNYFLACHFVRRKPF